ncbi:S8 family peptidase [Rapidithrix thailandica]|uniref:S8 family peptidase n=1 Tax=Rapidithrix thailandica TaxID=413964 RepID=A0AAW9S4C0_9BACT
MKCIFNLSIFLFIFTVSAKGQNKTLDELNLKYLNWYNQDLARDRFAGTSVNKAYEQILNDSSQFGKTIIVAVIDGGVNIEHEDLKGRIWVNEDEIPGNNIDDDHNGYIDDIHGWNFIGNQNGENIHYENFEYTRIIKKNNKHDPSYIRAKKIHHSELAKKQEEKQKINRFQIAYERAKSIIKSETGISVHSAGDLALITTNTVQVFEAKKFLQGRYAAGLTEEGLQKMIKSNEEFTKYFLNTDFEARNLVGDNPEDLDDKFYGNPDVIGPEPEHGTSVAGVIAAIRGNAIGIDGIASQVKIMAIRSTPAGDERDKDVALSIYYAVDNGADIINMSFGKDFSPQKEFIDNAVKYAKEKGVLLIHASGNSGKNIDVEENYPNDRDLNGIEASNWLEVGASSMYLNTEIAAFFSNYGAKHVDIFAPGVNIISTDISNTYSMSDGTSLAAPVVSGIAALLLSRYPDLKPEEVIDILLSSALTFTKPKKVLVPSETRKKRKKTKFSALSKSGGIVNAYNALMEAEKRKK